MKHWHRAIQERIAEVVYGLPEVFCRAETVVMLYLTGPYVAVHWHKNA